ncbi:MAG: NUDIX domain-containing protein [Oscillibacter sp.]|nr:NUDIX domain-containing protein [Oscillibacter sp.]
MYKVFFKESFFGLTDDAEILKNHPEVLVRPDKNELFSFIHSCLEQDGIFHALIYHPDLNLLFSSFQSCFKVVGAAGGVVRNDGKILIIKRLGIPDLPKGHIEAGEDKQTCALREVREECGLQELWIESPLQDTWHIYFRDEKWHLKQTHWFTMRCSPNQPLAPQTEEDIEEVYWLPCSDIETVLPQTYASLRPVLTEVQELCDK